MRVHLSATASALPLQNKLHDAAVIHLYSMAGFYLGLFSSALVGTASLLFSTGFSIAHTQMEEKKIRITVTHAQRHQSIRGILFMYL